MYLAYRDPRTPWYARTFAAIVVTYAFSPLDLIPDPIPVLGYLDDLVLVPLGIWIALNTIPEEVMEDSRTRARELEGLDGSSNLIAASVIILLWLTIGAHVIYGLTRLFRS